MSKSGLTCLEYGRERAKELSVDGDIGLAIRPGVFHDPEVGEMVGSLQIPTEDIINFAADRHHVDPYELTSMAIHLRSPKNMNKYSLGDIIAEPQEINDEVYYPTIELAVMSTNTGRLNRLLRHEVRHIFQPYNTNPRMEHRKNLIRGIKVVSGLAVAAVSYDAIRRGTITDTTTMAELGAGIAEVGVISLYPGVAEHIAWTMQKDEWDAVAFGLRNRSFKPISAVSGT
jgi:hypothetical protein